MRTEKDYNKPHALETALNNGINVIGKPVSFGVDTPENNNSYGYTLPAGNHLKFIPKEAPSYSNRRADFADKLTVQITSVKTDADSYIINYDVLFLSPWSDTWPKSKN